MEQWNNGIGDKNNFSTILLLHYLLPFSTSLIFAFTQIFWSQSVVAEVYTLNTFFVAVIIWLLLIWAEKIQEYKNIKKITTPSDCCRRPLLEKEGMAPPSPLQGEGEGEVVNNLTIEQFNNKNKDAEKIKSKADKVLLFTIFLFGLSLTNHQMMALLAPILLIFVLWADRKIIKDYKFIFVATFLFVIGISLYLYLPIRAAQNPAFNWGNPQGWESFQNHLLRRQYNDLRFTTSDIFNKNKLSLVNSFLGEIVDQFTIVGVILILLGFIWLYFKSKKIFFLTFGALISNSFLIILLRTAEYTAMNDFIFRVYYLPAFLMLAIWLGGGLYFLIQIILKISIKGSRGIKIILTYFVFCLLLVLPFSFLLNNYQLNNRRDFWLLDDWARNALMSLEPNSYLLIYNDQPALDSMLFSLTYLQAVENLRLDVKIVNFTNIHGIFFGPISGGDEFFKWSETEKKEMLIVRLWGYNQTNLKRPLYVFYPLGEGKNSKLATVSNGFVFRVYENISAAKKAPNTPLPFAVIRNLIYSPLEYNIFFSDFISDYYYAQASYYLETGYSDLSQKLLVKAIKYDASPFSFNYQAFVEHRAAWTSGNSKQ